MKKEQPSQADFYSILVSELKTLETTRREYERLAHSLRVHLDNLTAFDKHLAVVDAKSNNVCQQVKETLADRMCIPRWFMMVFIGAVCSLLVSLCFNFHQCYYNKYLHKEAQEYIAALEAELSKKNSKSNR